MASGSEGERKDQRPNLEIQMERLLMAFGQMNERLERMETQHDLHLKLQQLTQGNRSVDEYYEELELALIRANVEEDCEAKMDRFLNGLNPEIADIVEMQPYEDMEELVYEALKVEEQLMRRRSTHRYNYEESNTWRTPIKREEPNPPKVKLNINSTPKSAPKQSPIMTKTEGNVSRTYDIQCFKSQGVGHIDFQCTNRETLVMDALGELNSEKKSLEIEREKLESLEIECKKSGFENDSEESSEILKLGKEKERSELESHIVSYPFLKLPLCKEFFFYSNPLAGSIPSNKAFLLQNYGEVIPNEVQYIMPLTMVKEQQVDKEPLLQGYDLLSSFGNELVVFDNNQHVKEHKIYFPYVLKAFETIEINRSYWHDNDLICWKNNIFVPKCSLYELYVREAYGWNLLDQFRTTTLRILHANIFCETYKACEKFVFGKSYRHDWIVFKENRLCMPTCSLRKLFVRKVHEGQFKIQFARNLCEQVLSICILVLKSGNHYIFVLGMYEWLVLLFGIINAPSILTSLMSHILRVFNDSLMIIFFEYVLIYSKELVKHEKHLKFFLDVFRHYKLFANLMECNSCTNSIAFFGFVDVGKEVKVETNQKATEVSFVKRAFFHEAYKGENQFAFDPGDKEPFQILEHIKLDLLDLRTNPSQEEENDSKREMIDLRLQINEESEVIS